MFSSVYLESEGFLKHNSLFSNNKTQSHLCQHICFRLISVYLLINVRVSSEDAMLVAGVLQLNQQCTNELMQGYVGPKKKMYFTSTN